VPDGPMLHEHFLSTTEEWHKKKEGLSPMSYYLVDKFDAHASRILALSMRKQCFHVKLM
jgi:hypothetical protein